MLERQPRTFKRSSKVAERIRQELSDLFRREISDPRLQGMMVTGVDLEDDMRDCEVRVCKSLAGAGEEIPSDEKKKIEKALKEASPFLFEKLKRRLQIRHTPWIRYRYDDSLEHSARVWALLSKTSSSQASEETES